MDIDRYRDLHKISVVIEITDIKQVQMFMGKGMVVLAINPSGEDYDPPFTYCLGWPKDNDGSYPREIEHHIFNG